MSKATINMSPLLTVLRAEAEHIGVSFPALLTADLARYREIAGNATPALTEWEWRLLAHVLDGIEQHRIITGDDRLPSPLAVIAEIETWCDGAADEEIIRAGALTGRIREWSLLSIAGVLLHLRACT